MDSATICVENSATYTETKMDILRLFTVFLFKSEKESEGEANIVVVEIEMKKNRPKNAHSDTRNAKRERGNMMFLAGNFVFEKS